VYNPDAGVFEFSNELSNLGYDPNASAELTAYEQAYGPVIEECAAVNDLGSYYLFNINPEYDEIYELIAEYGDDRIYKVFTVGLDDTTGWYAIYLGDLETSADYGYITMDDYDGDAWDGQLTVNGYALGTHWLEAYTLDEDFVLCEEDVYSVEEGDDWELDGTMVDRFSVTDPGALANIDIRY